MYSIYLESTVSYKNLNKSQKYQKKESKSNNEVIKTLKIKNEPIIFERTIKHCNKLQSVQIKLEKWKQLKVPKQQHKMGQ